MHVHHALSHVTDNVWCPPLLDRITSIYYAHTYDNKLKRECHCELYVLVKQYSNAYCKWPYLEHKQDERKETDTARMQCRHERRAHHVQESTTQLDSGQYFPPGIQLDIGQRLSSLPSQQYYNVCFHFVQCCPLTALPLISYACMRMARSLIRHIPHEGVRYSHIHV